MDSYSMQTLYGHMKVLFSTQTPSELIFFKTFIVWLNLDFGIETCFINNLSMNAFWKSWLQFVFPFSLQASEVGNKTQ